MRHRLLIAALWVSSIGTVSAGGLSSAVAPRAQPPAQMPTLPFQFELEQSASLATDFPPTATSTSFTYRLDPNTGLVVDLIEDPLSPLFVQPGNTIGRGGVRLGLAYLHAHFTTAGGASLDGLTRPVFFRTAGLLDPGRVTYEKLDLRSDTTFIGGAYGLTEVLDVGVVVPVVSTRLDTVQRTETEATGGWAARSTRGSAAGLGDLRFRAKYRVLDRPLCVAPLTELRVPTGSSEDFHGLDRWFVGVGAAASWMASRLAVNGNFRFDVALGDPSQTRVTYGASVSTILPNPLPFVTLGVDFLGVSQLKSTAISDFLPNVAGAQFRAVDFPGVEVEDVPGGVRITQVFARQDRLDLAPWLRIVVARHLVASAGVLVAVNDDGIRADLVPTIALEARF